MAPHVQNELAEFVLELDAGLKDGEYQPTAEELAGIDRGLRAAAEGGSPVISRLRPYLPSSVRLFEIR